MLVLQGSFDFLSCGDLFRLLKEKQATGFLTARHRAGEKRLGLQTGSVITAVSNDPREYLGQILIQEGHLTEEAFLAAHQAQQETRVPLGRILSMTGAVPLPTVRLALEKKVRETALGIFDWSDGTFSFTLHQGLEKDADLPVSIPMESLAREGEERVRTWHSLRGAFPSGNVRIRRVAGAATKSVQPLDVRILDLLEDPRSIDDLILELHSLELVVYERLRSLLDEGAIERTDFEGSRAETDWKGWFPTGTGALQAPRQAPGISPLVLAREALGNGDAERAVEILDAALPNSPSQELLALLRTAEDRLLTGLRAQLLQGDPKPLLVAERETIRSMPLSPPERYLLRRMDGTTNLESLLQVSPLRQIDGLRLVKRLLGEGLIRY